MYETKTITIPSETREKLQLISEKFSTLNTGSTTDEFWLGTGATGDYSWTQYDLGVNKKGELLCGVQSGCSCNGPEEPSADATYLLDKSIELSEAYSYDELSDAVEDLVGITDTLYKVLTAAAVTPKEVIGIPNSEIRRAVVELIGYDKILDEAEVLDDSATDGRLLRIKLDGDEDIVLVHVKDPSTDREYFLRVPPKMKTAKEARAWTFGFEAADFELAVER